MQAAYEAGLVIQPSSGAVPRFKRYLDEQKGRPSMMFGLIFSL
jgi:hypothetical protein